MKTGYAAMNSGEEPVHLQICGKLADEIRSGYRPGDVLPSEKELAKRFSTTRHMIRMAIEVLVNSGMVGRYQGKGTVVQQQLISYPIHAGTRFTETLESCGRHAESLVLRKIGIPAPEEVAGDLMLDPGEPVILLETLRKMDGAPFSISSHFFPLDQLFEVMKSYESGSLHGFIFETYGIRLKRIRSLVSAILPDSHDADLLDIRGGMPLLRVKSINVDVATNVPLEFVISRFKGVSTELSIVPG